MFKLQKFMKHSKYWKYMWQVPHSITKFLQVCQKDQGNHSH